MTRQYKELTQDQVDFFLENGWLKLSNCFSPEMAEKYTNTVWSRLAMSSRDMSTWTKERINLPANKRFDAVDFAPRAWTAICDLLGGEERISEENKEWGDGLIVNLGTPQGAGKDIDPRDLPGWHVDGDFFVHYLDSPEQGLLVIPIFTEIKEGGGGTMICPGAIPKIAKHLYEHPEGVSPRFTPRNANPEMKGEDTLSFFCNVAKSCQPSDFVEATGQVGDIYLLHPLMLHSASNNKNRTVRIITNPPVSLRDPFFSQPNNYSIVEQKTMKELGVSDMKGWKITAPRQRVLPARLKIQAKLIEEELRSKGTDVAEIDAAVNSYLDGEKRRLGIVAQG